MDFNLVQIALTVRTDDAIQLSQCLPLLGKEFAAACRNNVCRWPAKACDSCARLDSCPWHLVFGQKLATDPSELKRHQKPPLPFAFSFPDLSGSAEIPREIECGLVVVGQAIPCLNLLLEGFAELLSREACPVPAGLTRIGSRDFQGAVHPLRDGCGGEHPENLVVLSVRGLLEGRLWVKSAVQIRLISPLRLVVDGRTQVRFDFSSFARSLLRRVSSLAYYYGACEDSCDYKELSRQAEAVLCSDDHFSLAAGQSRKMSGLIGHGIFCGEFSGLLPYLVAGSYFHAGKGASFGMGRFELLPGSGDCGD